MGETPGLNFCDLGFCGGARLLLPQAPDKGTHFARFHATAFRRRATQLSHSGYCPRVAQSMKMLRLKSISRRVSSALLFRYVTPICLATILRTTSKLARSAICR